MARAFVSLGANLDPEANLRAAVGCLRARFGRLAISPVYRSTAVGFDGPPFLNGVAAFEVDAPPLAVWQVLRDIEGRAGRDRSSGMLASRPLDLDLLLYGALVRSEPPLRLPHPDVTRYSFVLRPLADLAPDERHPVLGRTFADLDASLALEPAALERVALDFGDDASGDSDLTG